MDGAMDSAMNGAMDSAMNGAMDSARLTDIVFPI